MYVGRWWDDDELSVKYIILNKEEYPESEVAARGFEPTAGAGVFSPVSYP
jgi:hypothetical protein